MSLIRESNAVTIRVDPCISAIHLMELKMCIRDRYNAACADSLAAVQEPQVLHRTEGIYVLNPVRHAVFRRPDAHLYGGEFTEADQYDLGADIAGSRAAGECDSADERLPGRDVYKRQVIDRDFQASLNLKAYGEQFAS